VEQYFYYPYRPSWSGFGHLKFVHLLTVEISVNFLVLTIKPTRCTNLIFIFGI